MTHSKNKRLVLLGFFGIIIAALFTITPNAFSQDYEMTINQRRMGNQIGAEIWIKSLKSGNSKLGDMTISLLYNETFLKPAALSPATGQSSGNPASYTDSIYYDLNVTAPYVTINAPYGDNNYGFDGLDAQAVESNNGQTTVKVFTLSVKCQPNGAGYTPGTSGKGSLVGVLKFDIQDPDGVDLSDSDYTQIDFNTAHAFAPQLVVIDRDGNDVSANVSLTSPGDFAIRDVTILSPNLSSSALKRYCEPALESISPNPGYPVYFERSGLLEDLDTYGPYGTATLAYSFAVSLDDGVTWTEAGRFAETYYDTNTMPDTSYYYSGEIAEVSSTEAYIVTRADGDGLPSPAERTADGYGGVLRFIWKADANYAFRSEEARLKLTQLDFDEGSTYYSSADIDNRSIISGDGRDDISDNSFVLGRMFFVQLDGEDEYFRTKESFSTPSEITVEAWVNLNTQAATDAEPAIVASGSPSAQNEGPWMLYLKNGVYPAFRALERDGDTEEFVADVVSPVALPIESASGTIDYAHGDNWNHVAATVKNGTVKLFLNGEVVAQETNTSKNTIHMYPMSYPVYIGVNPNNNGLDNSDNFINAGIKEVKVWNSALEQEKIRRYISGVYDPSDVPDDQKDDRNSLELYYPLQADYEDYATEESKQWGNQQIDFFGDETSSASNELINYRPDRAHVKLTAPTGGEGISNLEGETFEVRWAAYGLGSVNPNTADLQIMVSRDGGITWFDAIGEEQYPAKMLDRVEIEDGSVLWSPFNNATEQDYETDLQALVSIDDNYAKECLLKISGTEEDGLSNIYSVSDTFTVAPHFAFANTGAARVEIEGTNDLALTGSTNMIEAWIRPYDFPSQGKEYPIFCKKSGTNLHYSLSLMSTGQLKLSLYDTLTSAPVEIVSSLDYPVVEPFTVADDADWTHIAVWMNLADGGTSTSVRFYIDGILETVSIGQAILIDRNNEYPVYMGFEPNSSTPGVGSYFNGEMKEVRFWSGNPGGVVLSGNEPSDLTLFIQGAQGVRADELINFAGTDYRENLVAAWSFDGGSKINGGIQNSVAVYPETDNEHLIPIVYGTGWSYSPTKPYIKIVEPTYKQSVSNQSKDLRVRWVGWDYDRNDGEAPFRNGSSGGYLADLEFSTGGGGGEDAQPYQAVANQSQNESYQNAMMLNYLDKKYEFPGTSSRTQYALDLDMSITDPDIDDDYVYSDQGPIEASQNNGRFKLIGRATMNGSELSYSNGSDGTVRHLLAESELFNITPPSNFTLRVLLEGYHSGSDAVSGGIRQDLAETFEAGGLSIRLHENQAGTPGDSVAYGESSSGYSDDDALSIANRQGGENNFANVPFVFTELSNGRYFVTVDHINHLPVTSAYAAPFVYTGDDEETWNIESGWDFSGWNGVTGNEITQAEASQTVPSPGNKFTASGPSETNPDEDDYSRAQLIYNNGRAGDTDNNQIASMAGGDVYRDGKIDALDRNMINQSVGGISNVGDVTGDGLVNSADRIIVYRNDGKTTSPADHPTGAVVYPGSPGPIPAPMMMADYHDVNNEKTAEMIREQQRFYENGGTNIKRLQKQYPGSLQSSDEISYEVYGEAKKVGDFVDVEIFIKNTGVNRALGNSTFGLEYDPSKLVFDTYYGQEQVLFSSAEGKANNYGYSRAYSNPTETTIDPIPGLRTIDIVHAQDAPGAVGGAEIPHHKTSLGILRFKINRIADYKFKWHRITNVNDVDGVDITEKGDFKFIEPVMLEKTAEITYPTAGIELTPGRSYTIRWTEPEFDEMSIDIMLSTDGGEKWHAVNKEPVSIAAQEYFWTTPEINSADCLLKLQEHESEAVIDEMRNPFAIMLSPVDIIKPCRVCGTVLGGSTGEIVWQADRKDEVYFEFSENGLNNWEVITDNFGCDRLSISWQVPDTDTYDAVVRMKTAAGEVIATSTPFAVLSGALTITNPNGTIISGGKKIDISWMYDNVAGFDLYFSGDEGNTWEVIAEDINPNANTLRWLVPNIDKKNAMLKACFPDNEDLEYCRTEFVITKSAVSGVADPAALGYTLSQTSPNPMSSYAEMTLSVPKTEKVSIVVYDITGSKVKTVFENRTLRTGKHSFGISADKLPTGTYFVYMSAGKYTITKKINVIK